MLRLVLAGIDCIREGMYSRNGALHTLWQSFQNKLAKDPSYHWQTHYEHFGMEYQARCAIRDLAGSVLKSTDWVKTMQGFDAAQARRDEHQG